MPWRMLLFLAVLMVVVVLFAANIENRGSISFIFTRLDEVPIFMAVLFSFIAGALTMLPFTTGRRRRGKEIKEKPSKESMALREKHEMSSTTPPIGAPLNASPAGGRTAMKQKPRRRRDAKRE